MKRQLLYLMSYILLATTVVSCVQDDGATSINPDPIARFETSEEILNMPEEDGNTVYEIGVEVNYPKDEPVVVTYEMEGDLDLIEIVSEEGRAVIPAGEQTGKILFTYADDNVFTGDRCVTIRVTGSNAGFAPPTGVAPGLIEKQICIIDDEIFCEPSEQEWNVFIGSLNSEDVGFGNNDAEGTFTANNCNLIVTGNLPNSNAQINAPFLFQMTPSGLDDGKGTVLVDNQPYGSSGFTYQATGTYDISIPEIRVSYEFINPSGDLQWDGTNIITPN